ncbi:MAG TPA: C13 family peptidase [Steroidobacteraceae bacterium]|nr:C13 family peptidase [Steroidobacteraceae bacterium]
MSWTLLAASFGVQAGGAAQLQRELIDAQVARFADQARDQGETTGRVFFLGFAGYGEERVFAEEIKLAAQRVGEKYGSSMRSVLLINDRRDLASWPLASPSSLRYSLKALARVMNPDEDVLFLALSSHGSPDATLDVSNTGMTPEVLSAGMLAGLLAESAIRWKVVVVSACYSGTFVKPLADEHTIVITAAAKNRPSFGCSDQRDLTYFGEAFYRDAMPDATYLRAAFEAARKEIAVREKDEEVKPSKPQASFGPLMEEKLRGIEGALSPPHPLPHQGR